MDTHTAAYDTSGKETRELIFTRREGGRARLLAARGRSFAAQFVDPAERLDRWQ